LSGREGTDFMRQFRNSGLAGKVALTVNPFMVEDCLQPAPALATGLPNALPWAYTLENDQNQRFTSTFEATFDQAPNPISLLTYETGLALGAALEGMAHQPFSKAALTKALSQTTTEGPRGKVALGTTPLQSPQPVYIR